MARAKQQTFEGMEQEQMRALENQADKVKVDLTAIKAGRDDLKNHRAKIAEIIHANEDKVAKDPETGDLVYKRGEYSIRVHGKETVSVTIADEPQE